MTILSAFVLWSAAAWATETMRFLLIDAAGHPMTDETPAAFSSCVRDTHTGLLWENKTRANGLHDAAKTYVWRDIITQNSSTKFTQAPRCGKEPCDSRTFAARANAQRLCNTTDWRLPTREELRTLVDYDRPYPGPVIDTKFFPHTGAHFYWSASVDASDPKSAWGIGFESGFDYAYPQDHALYIRLVQGPPAPPASSERFIMRDDGSALDQTTGLAWQRCSYGQTWINNRCTGEARYVLLEDAQRIAAAQSHWRLPTISQLAGIVQLARIRPAIDTTVFPGFSAADYWTATPYAGNRTLQWMVNFLYGDSYASDRQGVALVRWVTQP